MRLRHSVSFALFYGLLTPAIGFAGTTPFLIINRSSDLSSSGAQGAALQALNTAADQIQDTINNGFLAQSARQTFADNLARTDAGPDSALLADRASNPNTTSIGIGGQGSVYYEGSGTSANADNKIPALGVNAQGAVTVGTKASNIGLNKLGPFDSKRLMLFGNFAAGSMTSSGVTASIFNVGVNALYDIVPSTSIILFGWGGVKFLTGINFATSSISYSGKIKQSTTTTVSGENATVNVDMDYTIGAKSSVFYVPLELSTNVTLFYLFTLYLGGSADISWGSSSLIGSGSGPITASTATNFGVANAFSGTGSLNLDDGTLGRPSIISTRAFGGMQLNVWALKLAMEGTVYGSGAKSVAMVGRIAF